MSAYVCDDRTINKIVTHLVGRQDCNWLRDELSAAIGPHKNFERDLGSALFAMNVAAVEQRYGKGEARKFRALNYRFAPEPATELQVYRAIGELVYQCSEGDVSEKQVLYRLLRELKAVVADSIIESIEPRRGWGGAA